MFCETQRTTVLCGRVKVSMLFVEEEGLIGDEVGNSR
jgi:hypothetical protein